MITVVGHRKSRAFRVLWMLEELGLDYAHTAAAPHSDAARAVNPTGKIPAIVVDGAVLTDSTAICQYLADREGRLTHPSGSLDRARQDGLTQRILDEFDSILWTAARHSFVLPEDKRVPAIKDSLRWEFDRAQTALAQDLGDQPFLMGDQITLPDLILAHCMGWATTARFEVQDGPLRRHLSDMRARPAYRRAAAQD